jgi:hypothetical protein
MKRACAVAALAALLLTGCRAAGAETTAPDGAPTTPASSPGWPTIPASPPAADQPAGATPAGVPVQVDSDLRSVDDLLRDLDDDASMADQAPPDRD